MTTTQVTCAKDLLTVERFLDFCERWKEDKRCPHGFSDYLRDLGLEKQATNADWAATYKDRLDYVNPSIKGGPTPRKVSGQLYAWWRMNLESYSTCTDDLYPREKQNSRLDIHYETFAHAIAAFLDLFVIPKPE